MFVQAQKALPLHIEAAGAALAVALAGGLDDESRRAAEEGAAVFTYEDAGNRTFGQPVLVELLPAERVGCTVVVPLRWEAAGKAGRLFPWLDANLTLSGDGTGGSVVSIVATYRPPADADADVDIEIDRDPGAGFDRTVLSHAVDATLAALLEEIAAKLMRIASVQAPASRASTIARMPENLP